MPLLYLRGTEEGFDKTSLTNDNPEDLVESPYVLTSLYIAQNPHVAHHVCWEEDVNKDGDPGTRVNIHPTSYQ